MPGWWRSICITVSVHPDVFYALSIWRIFTYWGGLQCILMINVGSLHMNNISTVVIGIIKKMSFKEGKFICMCNVCRFCNGHIITYQVKMITLSRPLLLCKISTLSLLLLLKMFQQRIVKPKFSNFRKHPKFHQFSNILQCYCLTTEWEGVYSGGNSTGCCFPPIVSLA